MEKVKVLETINKAEYKVRVSFFQNGVVKSFIVGPGELYVISPEDIPANDTLLALSRGLCKIYELKITTNENLRKYYKYDSTYFKTNFVYNQTEVETNKNYEEEQETEDVEIKETIKIESEQEEETSKETEDFEIKETIKIEDEQDEETSKETEEQITENKPKKGRPKKSN